MSCSTVKKRSSCRKDLSYQTLVTKGTDDIDAIRRYDKAIARWIAPNNSLTTRSAASRSQNCFLTEVTLVDKDKAMGVYGKFMHHRRELLRFFSHNDVDGAVQSVEIHRKGIGGKQAIRCVHNATSFSVSFPSLRTVRIVLLHTERLVRRLKARRSTEHGGNVSRFGETHYSYRHTLRTSFMYNSGMHLLNLQMSLRSIFDT